jgi:adenylate cyclase
MKREIERRFLVDPNKLPLLKKGVLITQGYLTPGTTKKSPIIRVRTENKKAKITIKIYRSELTKEEYEYPIPLNEAERLLTECAGFVQKIRYFLKIGKHSWSVDVYEGENFPLIVAEIEIELQKENEKFEKPLWIRKEVTEESRFHAYSLAFKPFNTWKK